MAARAEPFDDVRQAYSGWCPLAQTLIDRLPAEGVLRWGLFDRPPYDRWSDGRIVCVGDAVHAMLPYMGQGAAMAIEDAVMLARALDAEDVLSAALELFTTVRKPRTDWIQNASRQRADFWEKTDAKKQSGSSLANLHLAIYPYDAGTAPLAPEASVPLID